VGLDLEHGRALAYHQAAQDADLLDYAREHDA
jgi:hypothetical protein